MPHQTGILSTVHNNLTGILSTVNGYFVHSYPPQSPILWGQKAPENREKQEKNKEKEMTKVKFLVI